MVNKLIKICKDRELALGSKNEILLSLLDVSPYVTFLNSISLINLTSLFAFGVFNIKSLCNAKFTVDVTPFFASFVLIFMSAHGDFSIA